jgi:hypothetical protein
LSSSDLKREVAEPVGADAARRGGLAIRTLYVLVMVVIASFAPTVIALITRQLPWIIAFGLLLVASALVSRWGVRLTRETRGSVLATPQIRAS